MLIVPCPFPAMHIKVDVCYLNTFLFGPTSGRIWNIQLVWDKKHVQIVSGAICHIISGAHMDILFIVKLKILMLIKWSYRSP
jgi:hypothetical protein